MILGLVLALSCGARLECDEERPCAGFGEICRAGSCVAWDCATSAQCPMEQHCAEGRCAPGCAEDSDCYPGEACAPDSGACAPRACTDTQADCAFQEFCDPERGECYEALGPWCLPCDDDGDCGQGNLCVSFGDNGQFCGVACQQPDDCPVGYSCTVLRDAAGNSRGSQCIAACWLQAEAG